MAVDRFLLDAMVGKLASYLRMCGYDAAYALDRGVEADDRLREIAVAESRRLVTRDVALARRAEGDDGPEPLLLGSRDVTDQLVAVAGEGYDLTPAARPARCGNCNGRLQRGDETDATRAGYVPDDRDRERLWRCVDCGQWFWKGSHWDRVTETLAEITPGSPDL
ncbi:Mut7-C RNAse domain-containing protein [Halobaculum sp. MBLA0143]|uniref:Mut7-C RNAse domain-containing protein n=1 Tax=Halobaculum sp. MBLA0143 TaxID=3079933 RepID=UPI0035233431